MPHYPKNGQFFTATLENLKYIKKQENELLVLTIIRDSTPIHVLFNQTTCSPSQSRETALLL
jgi:hypothetical protein